MHTVRGIAMQYARTCLFSHATWSTPMHSMKACTCLPACPLTACWRACGIDESSGFSMDRVSCVTSCVRQTTGTSFCVSRLQRGGQHQGQARCSQSRSQSRMQGMVRRLSACAAFSAPGSLCDGRKHSCGKADLSSLYSTNSLCGCRAHERSGKGNWCRLQRRPCKQTGVLQSSCRSMVTGVI